MLANCGKLQANRSAGRRLEFVLSRHSLELTYGRPASRTISRNGTSKVVSSNTKTTNMMRKIGAGCIKHRASRCGSCKLSSGGFLTKCLLIFSFQLDFQSLLLSQVWQDALNLTQTSGADDHVQCFFHYTTELGFRNITEVSKEVVEVFVVPSDCIVKHLSFSQKSFPNHVWHPF